MSSSDYSGKNDISMQNVMFQVRRYYCFIISKWLLIVVFGIFGAGVGYLYARFKKIEYYAKTTFVLEAGDNGSGGIGQYAGLASMMGLDMGNSGGIFQSNNIIELYTSRTMIAKALLTEVKFEGSNKLLIDHYIEFNKLRDKWKDPNLKDINFKLSAKDSVGRRLQDSLLNAFVGDINLNYLEVSKPEKKSSILTVNVKCTDEFFAKNFNDIIVANVNDFYLQTKTKKSTANVMILQKKVDSVRNVMNGAIYSAASVADATPNLNPTRQLQRSAPIQKSQFSAETNKSILGELVKNLELSKISLLKETPLIQVIDQPVYPLPKKELGRIIAFIAGGFISIIFVIVVLVFNFFIKKALPSE